MTAAADTTTPIPILPDALGAAARAFVAGPHRLLIGDERSEAADGRTFATLDPATGREIAEVPQAGKEDVERAVKAARAAFTDGPWTSMPAAGREGLMRAMADAMEERAEELAQIESLDNGKPVGLAQYVDVNGAVAHLRYFAGWPTKIEGGVLPVSSAEHALLHPPRACRGVRADHPVELSAADGRVEARTRRSRPGARSCSSRRSRRR